MVTSLSFTWSASSCISASTSTTWASSRRTWMPPGEHVPREAGMPVIADPMIQVKELNLKYGAKQALFNVNLDIPGKKATAFIGPSGCGKTTLLRCLNRLNDLIDNVTITGSIRIGNQEIYDPTLNVSELRTR